MNRADYAYADLSAAQYAAIVQAGSMGGTSPMLGDANYQAFIAACQSINCDPRVLLAGLLFEDHFGCDPAGAAAASVNDLSGIKWAGQASATDSGIPADTGGTYAKFATLGDFFAEYARTLTNQYIGPYFNAGDLVNAWSVYITGQPNSGHGQERVDQWQYYRAHYAPSGGGTTVGTPVYGEDIVRAAMKHLGQTHEYDARNGDHPVAMFCEADVEDWCAEAGVSQPAMPTAAANADRAPLNTTFPAPMGALVFFKGPGWSDFGHVGVSYSDDGGTISGLASVVVSSGWQAAAMGCVGWRFPDGVTAAHPPAPTSDPGVFYAEGNPYGAIPMKDVFWARWDALNTLGKTMDHPGQVNAAGMALPMLGYPVEPERTLASGRRVQRFERGWLGTQQAPEPWDIVALVPKEFPQ